MKRKLVKQGNGALTITLPYKWALNNNLNKGDYIEMIESGKDIILSTKKDIVDRSYEIEISKDRPFFKRYLKSCYILGYDKIVVFSKNTLPMKDIALALEDLIGFEIVEQSSTRVVISQIMHSDEAGLDNVIKRVFHMISSMFNDIIVCLEQDNITDLTEISTREMLVNKYVNFCLRILNKKGYSEFRKTPYVYQIITGLEQIGDGLRDFCLAMESNDKEVIGAFLKLKEYYDGFFYLFYKYNMSKIGKIKEKRVNLYNNCTDLIKKHPVEVLHIYQILSVLHQLEVALDPINN